jgi:hypothetical protein
VPTYYAKSADLVSTNAKVYINIDDCGAVGNGTTDDTNALITAITQAKLTKYKTVAFSHGKNYLIKSTTANYIDCVSILGNGATLTVQGNLKFDITAVKTFILEDLTIITDYAKGTLDNPSGGHLWYCESNTPLDFVKLKNLKFICTVSQATGIKRSPYAFLLPQTNRGEITNLTFENFMTALAFKKLSKNISITNVYGNNIETLILLMAGNRNISIDNASIVNTKSQQIDWVGKTFTTPRDRNGLDVILIESDAVNPSTDVNMSRVYGEFVCERVVYCQASNVRAYHITARNTQAVKYCGTGAIRAKNIEVNDVKIFVDDTTNSTNEGFHYAITQTYNVENLVFDGIIYDNQSNENSGFLINIHRNVKNVSFNNMKIINKNMIAPIVMFSNIVGDTGFNIQNIELINCECIDIHSVNADNVFFGFDEVDSNFVDGYVNGVKVRNTRIQISDSARALGNFARFITNVSKKITNIDIEAKLDDSQYLFFIPATLSTNTYENVKKIEYDCWTASYPTAGDLHYGTAQTKFIPKCKISGVIDKVPGMFGGSQVTIELENRTAVAKEFVKSINYLEMRMPNIPPDGEIVLPIDLSLANYEIDVITAIGSGKCIAINGVYTVIYTNGVDFAAATSGKICLLKSTTTGIAPYLRQLTTQAQYVTVRIKRI